jgi:hypothetical protein
MVAKTMNRPFGDHRMVLTLRLSRRPVGEAYQYQPNPGGLAILTQESVIALLGVNVVDVNVVLGQLSRRQNGIGFTGGNHGESAALGFPCELRADL